MFYVLYVWNSNTLGELHCYKTFLTLQEANKFIDKIVSDDPDGVFRFIKMIDLEVK